VASHCGDDQRPVYHILNGGLLMGKGKKCPYDKEACDIMFNERVVVLGRVDV